jgi:rhodanese-related sulfurtransferase
VNLLPSNRDTPLLVYCQTGRMSKIATEELVRLGYRNIADLEGGMLAWEKSEDVGTSGSDYDIV